MSRLAVRKAHPHELPQLATLAVACFGPAWSQAALAAECEAGAWLGVVGDPPRGLALTRAVMDEAELRLLAVAPAARRTGLGRALLRATLAELAGRGVRHVHLEVRATNAAALALYAHAGFVRVGVRPGYYPDGEDAVLLARGLAREAAA